MHAVRHLLAQRRLALLICAATLLLKLLIPTGYMVAANHGRIAIVVCPGAAPRAEAMAMPGMHGDMPDHGMPHQSMSGHGGAGDHGKAKDHGSAEMPCAFASLSAALLGAIDPLLLAALIAFVLATGFSAAIPPPPSRSAYLRPPLRGPPAYL
ncbi:hypothetical protein F1C10_11015 [Sphingomonas sp. NBWT7]|uniref:hypothetical protein n=1 Tax=Sphingomonas sp. NBWT7 TaxID=2596913 RepID=UPI0016277293|nr:hypothetical protein [Sphingomonas sp. NBWT7]QNE32421.1 hypothetical protein F1C10_11015 [Sphingomonas sp. NBWT7]